MISALVNAGIVRAAPMRVGTWITIDMSQIDTTQQRGVGS